MKELTLNKVFFSIFASHDFEETHEDTKGKRVRELVLNGSHIPQCSAQLLRYN